MHHFVQFSMTFFPVIEVVFASKYFSLGYKNTSIYVNNLNNKFI